MKLQSKKLIIRLFLLFLTIVSLGFGCKGLSKQEQVSVKPVKLNYWTVYNDVDQLEKFAAIYKARYPHVTINIRQVRYEEFDNLLINALADDVGPDIVSMHTRWLKRYQNKLLPMPKSTEMTKVTVQGKYFEEIIVTTEENYLPSAVKIEKEFVQTVIEDVQVGKNIYGLPLALDTMAIYYNKALLDKASIPESPKTWEEFREAVIKTTKLDNQGNIVQSGVALGAGNNIERAPDIVALFLMQNNVSMIQGNTVAFARGLEKPTDNHPTLESLRFYTNFARPTIDFYTWNEKKGKALDEFTQGKTVFYFGFAFDYPLIKARAPQMKLEIIPIPQLTEDTPINVANYWIESVVKKSKHPNEAWDFIRFITEDNNIAVYTKATRSPSPLRAHFEEQKKDIVLEPFVSSVLTASNWYRGRNVDVANQAIATMIEQLRAPYSEKEKPLQRDAKIILNAARVIQQTL